MQIARVTADDLDAVVPLMVAYCDFYSVAPGERALRSLAEALLGDPQAEGVQLLARHDGRAAGFATIYWSWSTAAAGRIGVMNDLYVVPEARGRRIADALIRACLDEARERGAVRLEWTTHPHNHRARAVYDRVGGRPETWVEYSLPT